MRMMDTPQRHRRVAPLCAAGLVADRLRILCDNALILLTGTNQVVTIEVSVVTPCPHVLVDIVVEVAREFVVNALTHGMYMRAFGRISVQVLGTYEDTRLVVSDDGWGLNSNIKEGNGIGLARELVAGYDGRVWLRRTETTDATLVLRHPKGLAT
jgi:nitrate/nitrite-specific signal transduction histidine kinase